MKRRPARLPGPLQMVVVMHGHAPARKRGWLGSSKHGRSATGGEHHIGAKVSGRCDSPTPLREAARYIFTHNQFN
jgi:hypothetical protein